MTWRAAERKRRDHELADKIEAHGIESVRRLLGTPANLGVAVAFAENSSAFAV